MAKQDDKTRRLPSGSEFDDTGALWRFAIAVYGREGVSESCLALQDRYGVDVPLLLFCAWMAAARNVALSGTDLRAAMELTRGWRDEVVRPLRTVRRRVKAAQADRGDLAPVYESVKASELAAERAELASLAEAAPDFGVRADGPASGGLVLANMKAYLACLDGAAGEDASRALETIAIAATAAG